MSKVAIVAGGTGYVGRAIAQRLAKDGWQLALFSRDIAKAKEFAAELGEGHRAYEWDLRTADHAKFIEHVRADFGRLDACICAAGIAPDRKSLMRTTAEEFETQMQGNAVAPLVLLRAAADLFVGQKSGVIIGITSDAAHDAETGKAMGAYAVAKAALERSLSQLHLEIQPQGVQVYAIAPGFMPGGMNNVFPAAFIEKMKASPHGLATAEQVADLAASLLSNQSNQFLHILAPERTVA